jgi:hypothetical protein
MSGIIEFSATNYWQSAGWVWRAVLASLKNEQSYFPALTTLLADIEAIEETHHWLLENASLDDLLVLEEALKKIEKKLVAEGPEEWNDPAFFNGYLLRFGRLMQALSTEFLLQRNAKKVTHP